MTPVRRLAVALALAVVTLLATPGVASAHAQLESTDPTQGAVLLEPPTQVVLHFGEPVEIDFGSVRVIGPGDTRVDSGGTHHPDGDSHAVAVGLPPHLGDGTYVVAWRVISADSHPVHGAYVFSVGSDRGAGRASALATSLADQSGSAVVGVLYGVVRTAAFAGLVLLVGASALVALAWPGGRSSGRVRRLVWWSWGILLTATVAGILVQGVYASALPLGDIARPSLAGDVLRTRFGEVEVFRIVLLAVLVPVLRGLLRRPSDDGPSMRTSPWTVPVVCLLDVLLLLTPGLAGHAGTGADPGLGLLLDVAHLAAVSAWLGGLALLATFLLPGAPSTDRPDEPWTVTLRISAVAFWSVVMVVATGVVQSIRQVGSFFALVHTDYGRTLIVKVALVAVLVGLGALSRRAAHGSAWWRPSSLRTTVPPGDATDTADPSTSPDPSTSTATSTGHVEPGAPRSVTAVGEAPAASEADGYSEGRLRRTVVVELCLAALILVVTSVLVNTVPARQAVDLPFTYSFQTLGVQVNSIVSPARVGPVNTVHVYILSSAGTPRAVPELDVSLSLPSESIGPLTVPLVLSGPGHYRATNVDIPVAGTWTIRYTIRTGAIDEDVVTAELPVH